MEWLIYQRECNWKGADSGFEPRQYDLVRSEGSRKFLTLGRSWSMFRSGDPFWALKAKQGAGEHRVRGPTIVRPCLTGSGEAVGAWRETRASRLVWYQLL